ncbi:MAG: hypothetical protein ACRDHZ_04350 [Ktedonobacteraceae bacterium]
MQQQQQKAIEPVQPRKSVPRGPLPWFRIKLAVFLSLIACILTVVGLLATGHLYDIFSISVAALVLIGIIIAILAWLFPFNPFVRQQPPPPSSTPNTSPSQVVASPVTLTQTSVIPTPVSPVLSSLALPTAQIFHFAESMPSPDEFYGRAYERTTLLNRTYQRSSTALVGEYRIGKSWLMQYLQQSALMHTPLGLQVRIGRMSATNPQCQTLPGFVKKALEVLNVPAHRPSPRETPLERLTIEAGEMKKQGVISVLCIDEFAGLMGKPGFDKSFVEGLRAIAEDEGLVLITASREPLHTVIEQITGETSPLFNIMLELTLQPFTEAEATMFIREKGQQCGLSRDEQAFFLACAAMPQPSGASGWPPLRLQLVGQLLLADKYPVALAQHVYTLHDPFYQADFKERLTKQYQAVVKP